MEELNSQRERARAAYSAGKLNTAIDIQRQIIQHQQQQSGEVRITDYRQLAFFLIAASRPLEAESVLVPVVEARPENSDLRSILGLVYTNIKQFDKAIPHLLEALAHDASCFVAADQLTRCYLAKKDLANTVHYGEMALSIKDSLHGDNEALEINSAVSSFDHNEKHGNVIAFSLWGDQQRYLQGALRNCELAAELYPSWQCRFYIDETVPSSLAKNLGARGADVRRMPTRTAPFEGLFWRFHVASDSKINRFLVRDCDSVINIKERVAVEQWLQSDKHFHVMRDYYTHTDLVMAGMWGGVTGVFTDIRSMVAEFTRTHIQSRIMDQAFLNECIWPTIKQSCMVHDSCFDSALAQPYPDYCGLPPGRHIGQDEYAVRQTASA